MDAVREKESESLREGTKRQTNKAMGTVRSKRHRNTVREGTGRQNQIEQEGRERLHNEKGGYGERENGQRDKDSRSFRDTGTHEERENTHSLTV